MILKILLVIFIVLLFKIAYNTYYWLLTKQYYKNYITFVREQNDWFIREHRQQIIKILRKAGIEDTHQPTAELAGYGMVATGNISVFRNLSLLREDICNIVNVFFREAIGVYKQRIFESFNPIYWIETIFQLPKILFEYLGFKSTSIIVKIFQILWWIIVAISTIVGIVFNQEFTSWLKAVKI